MAILFAIILYSAIFIPNYYEYSRRVRTTDAMDHTRMICNAVTDWINAPNMADGDLIKYPPVPVTMPGRDGHSFLEQFPAQAGWLSAADKTSPGADPYYSFTIDISSGKLEASYPSPVVLGTAWSGQDGDDIYGGILQSGGIGVESGDDLSGCKSNVERVSARY